MNRGHLESKWSVAWWKENLLSGNDKMMCKYRWRRDDEVWGGVFLKARGKPYHGVGAGIKSSVWNLSPVWCPTTDAEEDMKAEWQIAVSYEQNANTDLLLITEKLSPKLEDAVNPYCQWKGKKNRYYFLF